MSDPAVRIAENLARIHQQIAQAAAASGRSAAEVRLVAVTKYADAALARRLVAAGCRELGESRPQELWHKAAELADLPLAWHLVGHLQRNKVRPTLPLVSLIHSVDSDRLLAEIDRAAAHLGRRVRVLLEVNVSGEPAKHGFSPVEVADVVTRMADYPQVELRGLMTMAGLAGGRTTARRDFARLRTLRDWLQRRSPPGVSLAELSMGMSGDFDLAIAEGATLVRIGSALFEGVAD